MTPSAPTSRPTRPPRQSCISAAMVARFVIVRPCSCLDPPRVQAYGFQLTELDAPLLCPSVCLCAFRPSLSVQLTSSGSRGSPLRAAACASTGRSLSRATASATVTRRVARSRTRAGGRSSARRSSSSRPLSSSTSGPRSTAAWRLRLKSSRRSTAGASSAASSTGSRPRASVRSTARGCASTRLTARQGCMSSLTSAFLALSRPAELPATCARLAGRTIVGAART